MTHDFYRTLLGWLETGSDLERQHAEHRLAQPDAIEAKRTYPGLATMAGNAVKAAAGFVASGFATASKEEQARRLEVCKACPHFDPSQGRCHLCGCVASLKTRIASQHCPDNPPRW